METMKNVNNRRRQKLGISKNEVKKGRKDKNEVRIEKIASALAKCSKETHQSLGPDQNHMKAVLSICPSTI